MYTEMDTWTAGSFTPGISRTQPFLLECDTDLVQEALTIILNPDIKNSAAPESIKLVHALNNYIKECNNAFLASERIRLFLLLSLLASFAISIIAITAIPIGVVSTILIGIIGFILFSINIFTLYHQMSAYQQQIDWDTLKKFCSEYKEKLYSGKFGVKPNITNTLGKIFNSTSSSCLFAPKKAFTDKLKTDTDEGNLNHSQSRLPTIDKDSFEASINANFLLPFQI